MYKEETIINKIKEHFQTKYTLNKNIKPFRMTNISFKLKYDFNVNINAYISFDNKKNNKVSLSIFTGYSRHDLICDVSNDEYLNDIQKYLDELMGQINTYENFIKDFVDSVVDDLYNVDYHINLNTLKVYFKSDNGRAVIYPELELGHGGEYVTMYIDSIDGGNYPMKMYSSISFDDAKEMLDFYL